MDLSWLSPSSVFSPDMLYKSIVERGSLMVVPSWSFHPDWRIRSIPRMLWD